MKATLENLTDRLRRLTPEQRIQFLASQTKADQHAVFAAFTRETGTPWAFFEDDPVGFVTVGLGETVWSRQRLILNSVRDHKRTAVPACHAPGKSHIAARTAAWWVSVHPPGTATVVTTATTYRQVRNVLWPHIRRLQARHHLPGETSQVEWKIGQEIAAYGFSPADHDEAAVQGVHAPHVLIIVDEAGGIGHILGRALEAIMTGGHTRMLAIGNPATDNEDSWFERCCSSDLWNVIPISAYDTPNFTGEDTGACGSCPPEVPPHAVATHLVDQEWVRDVVEEFGDESAFVEARVHARFPRAVANKVVPYQWVEEAAANEDPAPSEAIRLGVDVAADGGDEFVIAWADGYRCTIRHRSSGPENANPMTVAGKILEHILEAEAIHESRGVTDRVRVKIDAIGVGWAICGLLRQWGDERRHGAEIVGVNVAERARDAKKFNSQRAEMWWNGRNLLQPQEGRQDVALDVDRRTLAQLSAPTYRSDSSGRILIESKQEMKRRGVNSPDRAEALLLALFEPPGQYVPTVAPLGFNKRNDFDLGGLSKL